METYITEPMDTWDLITFKVWGDAYLLDDLIEVNPDYRFTAIFNGGITINVPPKPNRTDITIASPWQQ